MLSIADQSTMLKWKFLLFTMGVLFQSLAVKYVHADCAPLSPSVTEILETDRRETVLLEFSIQSGDSWALPDPQPSGYIHLNTSNNYFSLKLLQALDLETLLSNTANGGAVGHVITLSLVCSRPGVPPVEMPFRVIVKEINEFPPQFTEPLMASIEEQSPGDTEVIELLDHVIDGDYGAFQMEGFTLHPYITSAVEDGFDIFYMKGTANGIIGLRPGARLDYETLAKQGRAFFMLNISVEDMGYPGSFTTYSTLRIDVTDVDDNSPVFVYDCPADCVTCPRVNGFCRVHAYSATAIVNGLGALTVYPAPIKAMDPDTLGYDIEYSMTVILPSSSPHFIINNHTGVVSQVRSLDDLSVSSVRAFLEAKEISPTGYGSTTTFSLEIEIQRSSSTVTTAPLAQQPITASTLKQTGTGFGIGNTPDDTFTNPDGSFVEGTPYSDVTTVNTTYTNDIAESIDEQDGGLEVWIIFAIIGGVILVVLVITLIVMLVIKPEKRQKTVSPATQWPENILTSPKLDRYAEDEILDAYREDDPSSSCNSSQRALIADIKTTNFNNGKLHNDLADPNIFVIPNSRVPQLPPLGAKPLPELPAVGVVLRDVGTDTINIKRQRRRDKDSRSPEMFDGTIDYDMEASPTFYTEAYKTKIKRSPRKAKLERTNPSYWVTVKDDDI